MIRTSCLLYPSPYFILFCSTQRHGIYRESILEHFLPISKQTPNPSAYIECQDVMWIQKIKIQFVMKWARLTRDHRFLSIYMMLALYIPSLQFNIGTNFQQKCNSLKLVFSLPGSCCSTRSCSRTPVHAALELSIGSTSTPGKLTRFILHIYLNFHLITELAQSSRYDGSF